MGTLIIFFFWFLWFGSCNFFTVAAFARQQRRYGNVLQELVGICTLKCLNLFRNLSPHNPLNPSTFKSSITSYFLMQFTTRSLCYLHNLLSFSHAFHSLFALLYAAYFFISNFKFLISHFLFCARSAVQYSIFCTLILIVMLWGRERIQRSLYCTCLTRRCMYCEPSCQISICNLHAHIYCVCIFFVQKRTVCECEILYCCWFQKWI